MIRLEISHYAYINNEGMRFFSAVNEIRHHIFFVMIGIIAEYLERAYNTQKTWNKWSRSFHLLCFNIVNCYGCPKGEFLKELSEGSHW